MKSLNLPVNFSRLPLLIRMERGLKLAGKVVEKKSGVPIRYAPVRALTGSLVPHEETVADANGIFSFDTLHAATYGLHVEEAHHAPNARHQFRPGDESIVLEMIVPEWSRLKVAGE